MRGDHESEPEPDAQGMVRLLQARHPRRPRDARRVHPTKARAFLHKQEDKHPAFVGSLLDHQRWRNNFFAEAGLFALPTAIGRTRHTPDEETTDRRAVCGKTALTVREGGEPIGLPYPNRKPPCAGNSWNLFAPGSWQTARIGICERHGCNLHLDARPARSGDRHDGCWCVVHDLCRHVVQHCSPGNTFRLARALSASAAAGGPLFYC